MECSEASCLALDVAASAGSLGPAVLQTCRVSTKKRKVSSRLCLRRHGKLSWPEILWSMGEKVHSAAFGDHFREAGRSLSAIISAQLLTLHIWNKCHEAMMVGCRTHSSGKWAFQTSEIQGRVNVKIAQYRRNCLFLGLREALMHESSEQKNLSESLLAQWPWQLPPTFPHPLPDVYSALIKKNTSSLLTCIFFCSPEA